MILNLSYNGITKDGIDVLLRVEWLNLNQLNLSKYCYINIMQMAIN